MLAERMVDVIDFIARDELINAIDVAVAQGRLSATTGRSAVAIAEEQLHYCYNCGCRMGITE